MLAPRDVEVDRVEEAVGGVVEGAPERRPGRLTSTSRSGEDMLWAPKDRVVVVMDGRIPGASGTDAAAPTDGAAWATPRRTGGERTHGPWQTIDECGYSVGVSGYAAMAQIREAHPRRAGAMTAFGGWSSSISEPNDSPVAEELVGRSFDDRLVEWWDSFTESLSQTTFYLLDPESWR